MKPWEKGGRHFRREVRCPYCGTVQDRHTAYAPTESRGPREGDIAVCTDCAEVSVFDSELNMKRWPVASPLPEDLRERVLEVRIPDRPERRFRKQLNTDSGST